MPPFVQDALHALRDPTHFHWHTITLLGFAIYIYAVEIERANWNTVFAGLAFWLMDWVNEVVNALVLHFTGYAPIWTASGDTSFQLLVGLNIEICLLFFVSGIVFTKQLAKDPRAKIAGMPNRWLMVLGFSLFSVCVELLLNRTGYFNWAYSWWCAKQPLLIVIFGYGTFYAIAAWVHDMKTIRAKATTVAVMGALVGASLLIFGSLDWL